MFCPWWHHDNPLRMDVLAMYNEEFERELEEQRELALEWEIRNETRNIKPYEDD